MAAGPYRNIILLILVQISLTIGQRSTCNEAELARLPQTQLDTSPIYIRSQVQDENICIQVTFKSAEAQGQVGWFAFGLSRTGRMVSSPPASVMMFQTGSRRLESYMITAHSSSGVTPDSDQSGFLLGSIATVNGDFVYSYQRPLTASRETDITISLQAPNRVIWAYADTLDITSHDTGTYGSATFNFLSGASSTLNTEDTSFCSDKNCAAIFGGTAFAILILLGIALSFLRNSDTERKIRHCYLIRYPRSIKNGMFQNPWTALHAAVADLCLGEMITVFVFLCAVLALILCSSSAILITGQLIVLCLMFLLLPVSHIPLWGAVFESSFERMIKFHRWLGTLLLIPAIYHLVEAVKLLEDIFTFDKYGTVYPGFGFIAFCGLCVTILAAAEPVRRYMFEAFYCIHRIVSFLTLLFAILHCSRYIGIALAVPLILYFSGLLWRYYHSYISQYKTALVHDEKSSTTVLMLESNEKTQKLVSQMPLGSYFWVQIPSISFIQWHPFSAIRSADDKSIGFVIKGKTGTYTGRVLQAAKVNVYTSIRLCGPFGSLCVCVSEYDMIVLIAGGIGITPMLDVINQSRQGMMEEKDGTGLREIVLVWTVRDADDLLMVDTFLPSLGTVPIDVEHAAAIVPVKLTYHLYVTKARTEGSMTRANDELLHYRAGRPTLDEYINTARGGKSVAVLACGPPALVAEAQVLAHECNFPFHKEVFAW